MKRNFFKRARKVTPAAVRNLGIGLLMAGVSFVASANDLAATPKVDATPAPATVRPKVARLTARTRRWFEVGLASWYGPHFQGRKTATGERFDMNQMTCAHPTLPMGTWLRVMNMKNHRTAFVRVNDRGPVLDSRIVDLSFAAAQSLGLTGVGRVRLDAVRSGDPVLAKAMLSQVRMPLVSNPLVGF
ncbi:MAG TPA: septal ring lytic transglycosylase RlpA family protein [Acidobacteriaceae bacterium]|nr:septal ring lytic transglycosylase RlpA family protein [Acidobacteriaceae bacterium]